MMNTSAILVLGLEYIYIYVSNLYQPVTNSALSFIYKWQSSRVDSIWSSLSYAFSLKLLTISSHRQSFTIFFNNVDFFVAWLLLYSAFSLPGLFDTNLRRVVQSIGFNLLSSTFHRVKTIPFHFYNQKHPLPLSSSGEVYPTIFIKLHYTPLISFSDYDSQTFLLSPGSSTS